MDANKVVEKYRKLREKVAAKKAQVDRDNLARREMLETVAGNADRLVEKWSHIPRKGIVRGLETEDPRVKHVDFLEGVEDPTKRRTIAMLMENNAKYNARLDETTRAFMVGPYEKSIFGIIRAVYANTILDKLVSVQPLDAPTGRIFYLDVRYTDTKGKIQAGTRAFDATVGPARGIGYPSEVVEEEAIATGDGVTSAYDGTLSWHPVRPGTVTFTDGTQVIRDDGAGNLIGDVYADGWINYQTGAYEFTAHAAPGVGDALVCSYEYNMEANEKIPMMDIVLTSSPVTARQFKLRARWSLEAEQDLKAYHGLSAEDEIVQYQANEINRELCYRVIRTLQNVAAAGTTTWAVTPGVGVPWKWHKEELFDKFVETSEYIFQATQRFGATWAVIGTNVARIIQTLDRFVPAGKVNKESAGIQYIGTLGDYECYKDPTMDPDKWLMGYKGEGLMYTGFVHAVYLGLYTTPSITMDDFLTRKGIATRASQKVINRFMYSTGTLV